MTILSSVSAGLLGCSKRPEKLGLAYSSETVAKNVRLLVDETWVDAEGKRHVQQEIFESLFEMIDEAEQFILLDFFLINDFMYEPGSGMRPLSRELVDRLVAKRKANPEVGITFITDPVNTVYGSIESPHFKALETAGVQVVLTDLNQLRDSNPIISKPWRLLLKRWGVAPGNAVDNPMGEGRISMRSMLKLLNFKANHRKVAVTEKSLLVTSANPHSASSAHWNVALRVDGAGQQMALEAERAVLEFSDFKHFSGIGGRRSVGASRHDTAPTERRPPLRLELLTERKIKDKVLELLANAEAGTRIDLAMFYFSDRKVARAFISARQRGCNVRVILDPNKDAFGRKKNGIPNRQTALKLAKAGVPLRWADTHGEQCHVKMLHVEHADETATLLLGSCNYTRRNMDNFNAECNLALTAPQADANMQRAREAFDRWWSNSDGRTYTVGYETYADRSLRRRIRAWLMET
ncbi:MAG: phospholipase D-like domain-containing protein, partial [Verrucomicrobiota bacterium]